VRDVPCRVVSRLIRASGDLKASDWISYIVVCATLLSSALLPLSLSLLQTLLPSLPLYFSPCPSIRPSVYPKHRPRRVSTTRPKIGTSICRLSLCPYIYICPVFSRARDETPLMQHASRGGCATDATASSPGFLASSSPRDDKHIE